MLRDIDFMCFTFSFLLQISGYINAAFDDAETHPKLKFGVNQLIQDGLDEKVGRHSLVRRRSSANIAKRVTDEAETKKQDPVVNTPATPAGVVETNIKDDTEPPANVNLTLDSKIHYI